MAFQLRLNNNQRVTLARPAVMGIVNVSPDSFFNPHHDLDAVLRTVDEMVAAGVAIVDVGGEASNPGAQFSEDSVGIATELERVVLAVAAIKKRFKVLVSVDTRHASVMQQAVAAGADMINDQRNLSEKNALAVAAALKTPVCLMHFFKTPRTPGEGSYADLLQQIKQALVLRVEACLAAGITRDRIILDPGFGQGHFAKNTAENFYLLANLAQFTELGLPILSGWSRKSMIGEVLGGAPPEQRLFGTIAVDTLATWCGAHILRTHHVKAAVEAAKIATFAATFKGDA